MLHIRVKIVFILHTSFYCPLTFSEFFFSSFVKNGIWEVFSFSNLFLGLHWQCFHFVFFDLLVFSIVFLLWYLCYILLFFMFSRVFSSSTHNLWIFFEFCQKGDSGFQILFLGLYVDCFRFLNIFYYVGASECAIVVLSLLYFALYVVVSLLYFALLNVVVMPYLPLIFSDYFLPYYIHVLHHKS